MTSEYSETVAMSISSKTTKTTTTTKRCHFRRPVSLLFWQFQLLASMKLTVITLVVPALGQITSGPERVLENHLLVPTRGKTNAAASSMGRPPESPHRGPKGQPTVRLQPSLLAQPITSVMYIQENYCQLTLEESQFYVMMPIWAKVESCQKSTQLYCFQRCL